MAYIQWSSRFEVGVPFIDADHKVLVDLLNRMNDASRADGDLTDVGSVLSALLDYTRYHFAREERAQAAAGYPDLDEHKRQHERLTQEAQRLFDAFRENPNALETGDVLDFLSDWLMDHILLHDMAIKPYVQASLDAVLAAEGMTYAGFFGDCRKNETPDWEKLSILVVEDSKAFAHVLRSILQAIGVGEVVLTSGVADGYAMSKARDFDLVFADWHLKDGDGMDLLHQIRASGNTTPVVMLTGYVDESLEAAHEGLTASEWLQKPVTSAELMACITRQVAC